MNSKGRAEAATPLVERFGHIDIYLFDQLLRQRIVPGMRVIDVGCGSGRNLVYLMRSGYEVFAIDEDSRAIGAVQALAATLAPHLPASNMRVERAEAISFPDGLADAVISSAVLHFARDDEQFDAMLRATWRVLQPGGVFSAVSRPRLASSVTSSGFTAAGTASPTAVSGTSWTKRC